MLVMSFSNAYISIMLLLDKKKCSPTCYLKSCWDPPALTASGPLPEALVGASGGASFTCDWWTLVVRAGRGVGQTPAESELCNFPGLTVGKVPRSVPHLRNGRVRCPPLRRAVVPIRRDDAHGVVSADPGT